MQRGLVSLFILLITWVQTEVFSQSALDYTTQGLIYTQNFDGLPNSGSFSLTGRGPQFLSAAPINGAHLQGWQLLMIGGTNANAGFLPGTGSSTASSIQSLGLAGSTERALGSLSSGSGMYSFGLVLTNTSGVVLNSITIRFTAEQWRKGGSGNKNTWTFRYKTGAFNTIDQPDLLEEANLNFSSSVTTTGAGSLNGNLPENQQQIAYTLVGINWKNGEQLLLRWDDADESGSDDACAIDNFSFSAEQVEDLPSIISKSLSNITAHTVQLSCVVNDNNARTSVQVEYDTSAGFIAPFIVYPQPDIITPGTGTTTVTAVLSGLSPGIVYYYRIRAINNNGVALSSIQHFSALVDLPDIITTITGSPGLNSANVGGIIRSDGGVPITEKGVQWSLTSTFQGTPVKIIAGSGKTNFEQTVTGIPQGTTIYTRAYAVNTAGTAYGNTLSVTTQTIVTSLTATSVITNAANINFSLKTAQAIAGLSPAAFNLVADGIDSAAVTAITGTGNSFTVTVNTGRGDGTILLQLTNDTAIVPRINNKPFLSGNSCSIDKSAPVIRKISIPDQPMKLADTVAVSIIVLPDPALLKLVSGNINGAPLSGFSKKSDSLYSAYFVITNNLVDVSSTAAIPVYLQLIDLAGNTSAVYKDSILQANDPIDASRPFVKSFTSPPKGIYKSGDTLSFLFVFSEVIAVATANGTPSFKLTIGNTSRQAIYMSGSGTDSLRFVYIVQQTDDDSVGIKLSTGISLNSATIKDPGGNTAQLLLPVTTSQTQIIVDGVPPKINAVMVPPDKLYTINDSLFFTINFTRKVFIGNVLDTPFLKLTIGSSSKNAMCIAGAGTQNLVFRYIVQKNDLDKTGISLSALLTSNVNTITDQVGNAAVMTLKNTGSLANVKIDAVGPVFTVAGTEPISVCNYDSSIDISNVLMLTDEEKGEGLTWKITRLSRTNKQWIQTASIQSNGGKIKPVSLVYSPVYENGSSDTLFVTATDGINETTKTVVITSQAPIKNNGIGSPQYICNGNTPSKIIGTIPSGGNERYEYTWELAGITDSASFSKAAGSNAQKDYSPAKLTANTWFRRKVISGACSNFSEPVKITVLKTGLWAGEVSSDWRNTKNWCDGTVPSGSADVFIPSGTVYHPMITDTASCGNIQVADNARLAIKGSLSIIGNIIGGDGTIDLQNGTLSFTGIDVQKINGACFERAMVNNLVINNKSGVILSDSLWLSNRMQLVNGFLQTNNRLMIKHGAQIGPSAAGTFIGGNISLLYTMPYGKKKFQLLGHPFTHSIGLDMIGDSMDISGVNGTENGFRNIVTTMPSAFRYDASNAYDSLGIDSNWIAFTHTNGLGDNAWNQHMGIRLLANNSSTGSNSYLPASVMLKFVGKVNTGDQEIRLIKGKYSGYNLVSNPYPAPVELSLVGIGKGTGKNFWVWNPEQGNAGGYSCVPFRSRYVLPAFGAIIVKAIDSINSSLLFTENCKTEPIVNTGLPLISGIEDNHIELRLETDSSLIDRIFICHSDSAWNGFDQYDGEKLRNSDINFFSISRDQKLLSIDVRPLTNETIIPIGLQANTAGKFRIKIASAVLPASNALYLHDQLLNNWIPLVKDSSYYFETATDSAIKGNNRFEISRKKELPDTIASIEPITASIAPVPASKEVIVRYQCLEAAYTSIRLVNASGMILRSIATGLQKSGVITIPVSDLPSGIYIIEIRSGNHSISKKMIRY